MNAISTRFTVLENDTLLGTARAPGFDATRRNMPGGQAEPKRAGALPGVAHLLHAGEHGEAVSLAEALRERYPSSPVVVLFLADHSDETLRAIGLRELERIDGFHPVLASVGRPVSPAPSAEVPPIRRETGRPSADPATGVHPPTPRSLGLTQRQMDVLRLMLQGKPNKLICRELKLAEGTVKCHVSAILRALDVGTRTQAALKAARLGIGWERAPAA